MNNIAVFADVQNIYYTTRQAYGRQFNYKKLWQRLAQQGNIVMAKAYAIDSGNSGQQKFQAALNHIGFEILLKPYIQRSDGSAKGDWDVGIAIDIMEAAASESIDTVVLLSGDGDFDRLLERVKQRYGVHTEAYGVAALTAKSLILAADQYHAIDRDLLL
ncbi:hypothetical protein SIN8267_02240 [Sinobacterium norvegicum]|uniref:NYN domain-containing protein n=1 Tax=Sinobacterium norvegicum TaxID=1641715 RepID=A0ABM9AG16_9GAMM|nr:NYN domain-containing protein [Sinobacterium norvegicum]CAH0992124.1 hypothetical protein SIN8267_02240 [Sinobacterium norvegicum]